MKDEDIDEILGAAQSSYGPGSLAPEPERLKRVTSVMQASLRPVRPLPPAGMLSAVLVAVSALISIAGASRAGFLGIESMSPLERVLIFSTLVAFVVAAASELVHATIPGSLRRVSAGLLLSAGVLALLAAFGVSFHDYQTTHFVSAGVACLITGLEHAAAAALLIALVLRRGFAVNRVATGLIAGTLAGLAGLGVLELQCSNFQAAHVLVWHTAVVPVSAAVGALSGWILHRQRRIAP